MSIIDIVLRSLKSILELEYPDYEVIVVDNASNDGSFERIRDFVKERARDGRPIIKLLRLPMNKVMMEELMKDLRLEIEAQNM
jgi:glycosyltransferase involved in cell wall biosynthesis